MNGPAPNTHRHEPPLAGAPVLDYARHGRSAGPRWFDFAIAAVFAVAGFFAVTILGGMVLWTAAGEDAPPAAWWAVVTLAAVCGAGVFVSMVTQRRTA